jgi:AraC-like DNA-binding protein
MPAERHLILQAKELPPSGEWSPSGPGWLCLRVAGGQGYWLQSGVPVRSLAEGDVLLAGEGVNGTLRASQLGPISLHHFTVQPRLLAGVLTVAEGHLFEADPNLPNPPALFFVAAEKVGEKFALLAGRPAEDQLTHRCACLELWSEAISGLRFNRSSGPVAEDKLRERLRQLVGQIPETELAVHSLGKLAEQLHCSERHFSRIFREEFGASLRARQVELRLQRARHLLASTHTKIINVALESGFRHLGLFNSMFKKRFGMTPSQWRRQNLPKPPAGRPRRGLIGLARPTDALPADGSFSPALEENLA